MQKIVFFVCCVMAAAVSTWASEPVRFVDKGKGISLTGPDGWFMTESKKIDELVNKAIADSPQFKTSKPARKEWGVLVAFTEWPFAQGSEANSMITLSSEALPPGEATPLAYSSATLADLTKTFTGTLVVKGPAVAMINGREAAYFEYVTSTGPAGKKVKGKGEMYFFVKGKSGFVLAFSDKDEGYTRNRSAFEVTVRSMVIQ